MKRNDKNNGFSSPHRKSPDRRLSADLWDAGRLLPPLSPDEYVKLKESIRQYGIRIPIVVDQANKVIDGRHRQRACDELGIYCRREVREFASDAERLEVAISLNANRRHLNRQQRRELIATYLKCDPRINDRHLGDIVGVSKNTVAAERKRMESTGQIDQLQQRMGRDGKERPARNRRSIITNSLKEAETAMRVLGDLPKNCEGKTLDITTAKRRAAKQRNKVEREGHPVVPLTDGDIRLYHCPFQKLEEIANIAPASVQLILTDIPYGQEFLGQIEDLAQFAERTLAESGLFVTLCGQYWLHKVIEGLGRHLKYRWVNASVWNGDATPVHIGGWKEPHPRVLSRWKPILVFSKGNFPQRGQWCDVTHINEKEKEWHPWQQPLTEVETLVRYFSEPGDLVVEPCGGGFTTAVACRNLGRRCIACDIDEHSVQRGIERLSVTPCKISDCKE